MIKRTNKGFTLLELLVVIGIIIILTGIVFINYRNGQQQLTLARAASKLAQDIRRAEEMSLASEKLSDGTIPSGGYGIFIGAVNDTSYILYVDTSGNNQYDDGIDPNPVETIDLEKGVIIQSLLPGSSLSINFTPPDPEVLISGSDTDEAIITIALESDPTNPAKQKTIKVNTAGRIEIN